MVLLESEALLEALQYWNYWGRCRPRDFASLSRLHFISFISTDQMARPEGAPHETDLQRWHLEVNEGQQVWRFDAAGKRVQTVVDRYFLGLPTVSLPPGVV
jgi:hypothetical protein